MRNVKIFTLVLSFLFMFCVLSGCGTKGYHADVNFQQGDMTYCLEDVVRVSEKDTDTTKAYTVSLLIYGDAVPINWNMNTGYVTSGIKLTLNGKDEEFSYSEVSFEAAEGVKPGFKNRVTFVFQIPEDSKLPKQGILSSTGGSSDPVEINISSAPGWDG